MTRRLAVHLALLAFIAGTACGPKPTGPRATPLERCLPYPEDTLPPLAALPRGTIRVAPDATWAVFSDAEGGRLLGWHLPEKRTSIWYRRLQMQDAVITGYGGLYVERRLPQTDLVSRVDLSTGLLFREVRRKANGAPCDALNAGSVWTMSVDETGRYVVVVKRRAGPEGSPIRSEILVIDDCAMAELLRGPPTCNFDAVPKVCPRGGVHELPRWSWEPEGPYFQLISEEGLEIESAMMIGDAIASVEETGGERYVVVRSIRDQKEVVRRKIRDWIGTSITDGGWIVESNRRVGDDDLLTVWHLDSPDKRKVVRLSPSPAPKDDWNVAPLGDRFVLLEVYPDGQQDGSLSIINLDDGTTVWRISTRDVKDVAMGPGDTLYVAGSRGVCWRRLATAERTTR